MERNQPVEDLNPVIFFSQEYFRAVSLMRMSEIGTGYSLHSLMNFAINSLIS